MSIIKSLPKLLLVITLVLAVYPVRGQIENHLVIKKNGFKNKVHYLTGDAIWLEWNKLPSSISGIIAGIGTDQIFVNGLTIPVDEIKKIHRYRTGFNFKAGGKTLQIAAPGFLAVVAANTLIRGDRPVWPPSSLVTGSVILATGLILPVFQVKHYRMGGRYTLRIVRSDPELLRGFR
jgi:hypothetical protein